MLSDFSGSTFRLFVSKKMLYISLPFTYIGITFAFWSGIYPTTIAQTNKFDYNTHSLTGISAIATGMGQVLGNLIEVVITSSNRWIGEGALF